MTREELTEVVAVDLAQGVTMGWSQYADEMWEDRLAMFDSFPAELSFISWRALVRQVANELGLVA